MQTRVPAARPGRACALVIAGVLLALAGSAAYADGDAEAGRAKAVQCQTCHGLDGLSKQPDAPNLAGQPQPYLITSLNEFRSGARKNEMMTIVAKSLSDADIADLSAYYSSIEITAKPPR